MGGQYVYNMFAMRGQRDGFGFAFYFLLKLLKSVGNALATMLTPKKVFLFSIDNGWAMCWQHVGNTLAIHWQHQQHGLTLLNVAN